MSNSAEERSGPQKFEVGHFQDLFAQAQENPADAIAFARQNLGNMKPEEKRTVEFTLKLAGLEKNSDAQNLLQELKNSEENNSTEAGADDTQDGLEAAPTVVDLDAYRKKRQEDINQALDKMADIITYWDPSKGTEDKLFLAQTELGLPKWEKLAQQSPGSNPEQDVAELQSKITRIKELVADYKIKEIKEARQKVEDVNET